ncbi:MAB_1171c family putative transporter [Streptomyces sp. NBC_01198]|uniref:MAB_1171c family putative transporter n=1 Tax=Streptomyces sp. NBC_01198 TaxID=2903769 RepID=UPI002E13E13C|nr:hypothetical protein OG702_04375 [Streptomyces sp. NBC_01198]
MRLYEMVLLPVLWSLALYGWSRRPSAPRSARILAAVWTCWALGVTVGTADVRRIVDRFVGVDSVTNLFVHLLSLAGTAGIVEFVREMTGRAHGRVSRGNAAGLLLASAALTTAFAVMPRPDGDVALLTYSQDTAAGYTYWAMLTGYLALGLAAAARICWVHGRSVPRGPVRTSLWLMRAATVLGATYLAHRFAYLTVRYAHGSFPLPTSVAVTTQTLLALTLLFVALAVVWPAFAEHQQKRADVRKARGIAPLWRLLQSATPEVALALPAELRRSNPRLRLYRLVIEIRDSALAVEPHLDAGHPAAAEAALRTAGFEGPVPAHVVEAVLVRYAVAARLAGHEGVLGGRPEVHDAVDLEAETRWFEQVAVVLDRPAVVRAAELLNAGRDSAPGAADDPGGGAVPVPPHGTVAPGPRVSRDRPSSP